jgi:hypothetical protein
MLWLEEKVEKGKEKNTTIEKIDQLVRGIATCEIF